MPVGPALRVFLICDDRELEDQLARDIQEAGGTVVERPEDAAIVVADGDAQDVQVRLRTISRSGLDVLGLMSSQRTDSLDDAADVAVMPLGTGELGTRLARLHRRRLGTVSRQELLAMAVESAGDVVEIAIADNVLEYVNDAFERTLGYTGHGKPRRQ